MNVVKSGTIKRAPVEYDITQHEIEGGVKFDWSNDNYESDRWFDTAEEAEQDVISYFRYK